MKSGVVEEIEFSGKLGYSINQLIRRFGVPDFVETTDTYTDLAGVRLIVE